MECPECQSTHIRKNGECLKMYVNGMGFRGIERVS